MSTPDPEEIELHLHEDSGVTSYPEIKKPLEQLQADDAASNKGAVVRTITSRWKKISLTVLTLLSYVFEYAAVSDVTAFYVILVR